MAVFKCKMCGGTVEFEPGATVGVCDSCGTKQTLPRLDDDRRANLYDRANHFRRNNDFDKAAGLYEQILNEDSADAEAYWSLVLCRYGIEYVEDPATHRRVPTVNRAQFTSVFDDDNYKSAIQYADLAQRQLYEEEARAINEIQKGILSISQKEEPFDVFICYKETDAGGRRTPDSVLANDLYHQLTQEGFKVFFARITLEDKLGTAYEPYIFAALNSAKVMVVLGTRPEYFNAVWVKNEWSRYLSLVKTSGGKKVLIPAYKDMDPYDLPEEFSHLQAQDMSKLGFMQDLIRGIKKIAQKETPAPAASPAAAVPAAGANTAPLLKRAFMFLEDGNWQEADAYCEKVLDIDPENAQAYLGKLMAEMKVQRQENLKDCARPFAYSGNYKKVVRFGGAAMKEQLDGYIAFINERNENDRKTGIYNDAVKVMTSAHTEAQFKGAAEKFRAIPGFKDADTLAGECLEKAEISRKDAIYDSARQEMIMDKIADYESAIASFRTISGWRDAEDQIALCQKRIGEIKAKEEADRLKKQRQEEADRLKKQRQEEADRLKKQRQEEEKRIAAEKAAKTRKKVITIVCACIAFLILLTQVIIPRLKYNKAMSMIDAGEYETALALLDGLEYKDSETQCIKAAYQYYKPALNSAAVGDTIIFGKYEQDNDTFNGKENIEWLVLAKKDNKLLIISQYALDCQPYNTEDVNVTWESCTLRTWLNADFFNAAFSDGEKGMIPTVTVSADENPDYNTNLGSATEDKVFLLSITETNRYFKTDEERMCVPTAYAKAHGAYTSSDYTKGGAATCWWWLRTPGKVGHYVFSDDWMNLATNVDRDGGVISYGYDVNRDSGCVRPALWIDLGD